MAERINIEGGEYVSEETGEEKNRYWVEVSSSLMNRVNALAIEDNESPGVILGEVIQGDRNLVDGAEESEE